jgi:hypothetical protein
MRKVRNVESNCSVSGRGPLSPETLDRLKRHAWVRNYYD